MNESAKNTQLKPYDFKIDEKDNNGVTIKKIYGKHFEYVIYRTDGSIRVEIDDDSQNLAVYLANHNKIAVDLARIYSWLPEDLSKSEPINKQIARAMSTNIVGNYEDAIKMLAHAEARIVKQKTIEGRLQYTFSALLFVAFISVISWIVSLLPLSEVESYTIYTKIALCGSLGGLLSIVVGFSSLEIDIDANWQTNCLIGYSRIIIAVIAALFSYFAIKSDIAFSFVNNNKTSNEGIYMIAYDRRICRNASS
jgi:hypothetical protein